MIRFADVMESPMEIPVKPVVSGLKIITLVNVSSMKKIVILLLIFSCSAKEQNSESGVSESAPLESVPTTEGSTPSKEESDFAILTIQGNNIWVRDYPNTGKVVMTLNEGDRCKVLQTGRYDVIRGKGNSWFEIEYEGKRGWVFGSQSNVAGLDISIEVQPIEKNLKEIFGENFEDLFGKIYLEEKKKEVKSDEEDGESLTVELDKNQIEIDWSSGEGAIRNQTYSHGISNELISIINYKSFAGAAGVAGSNGSLITNGNSILTKIPGTVRQMVEVGDGQFLLISDYAQMISGEPLVGYTFSGVFDIQLKKMLSQQQLGFYFTDSFNGFEADAIFPEESTTTLDLQNGDLFLTVKERCKIVDVNYKANDAPFYYLRFFKFDEKKKLFEEYRQEEKVMLN
ncbi:MAG: SH3 domain-containing protein [Flammeovirgaceae bacterium]|nr:SH3 domain-containing protein [Flammeovirgaceae bacterium]